MSNSEIRSMIAYEAVGAVVTTAIVVAVLWALQVQNPSVSTLCGFAAGGAGVIEGLLVWRARH